MLNYEDLYKKVGNLFYTITTADRKISKSEKKDDHQPGEL